MVTSEANRIRHTDKFKYYLEITTNMTYRVQLFYDPRIVGFNFLKDIYTGFGLSCPPAEDLKKPFFTDEKKDIQTAATEFNTDKKGKILKLTEMVMGLPAMRIEISNDK